MSPARKIAEVEEPDRVEGQPHPREVYDLIGQDDALARAARIIRSGRPPHGLMLAGPAGIGKATLAYRIARYVLKFGANAEGGADLSIARNDIVSRQVEAQSHPGLLVLKRPRDEKTGKLKTVVSVDEIRRLGGFFGLTSARGGWRVAIIDAADEMNDHAANALLKLLEEPPARALVILISHAPGRLLPTIRSRCQRLDLKPLKHDVLNEALARILPEADSEHRGAIVRLAEGSLGLALQLAAGDGVDLAHRAESLLGARSPDVKALLALADRVARAQDGVKHFGDLLLRALSRRIRARATAGEGDERSAALWEHVGELYDRALEVYLDPRQTVISSALAISSARRGGAI
jgi:DNA polymerase III subunit delta'